MKFLSHLNLMLILILMNCQTQPETTPIQQDSGTGETIQISLSVRDLTASLKFYSQLGFKILTADKNANVPWAFISDGTTLFMLSQNEFPSPALVYYTANFTQRTQSSGDFRLLSNESKKPKTAISTSPEGIGITLIETKSQFLPLLPTEISVLTGSFKELSIPVQDSEASRIFWVGMGFRPQSLTSAPPYILSDKLLTIGLHPEADFSSPALTYQNPQLEATFSKMQSLGLKIQAMRNKDNHALQELRVVSPDGQLIRMVSE